FHLQSASAMSISRPSIKLGGLKVALMQAKMVKVNIAINLRFSIGQLITRTIRMLIKPRKFNKCDVRYKKVGTGLKNNLIFSAAFRNQVHYRLTFRLILLFPNRLR